MRKVQTKAAQNVKTHIFNNFFFFKSCHLTDVAKCGMARYGTYDNITRRMRYARWITKATVTHSGYAIIIAFPLQQWSHERASMLRYTYIASLVV